MAAAPSDFDHYAAQTIVGGKTVPFVLNFFAPHPLAKGEHPVIDCEHIGDYNDSFMNDSIARANAKIQIGDDDSVRKLTKAKLDEVLETNRETIWKHGVRSLQHVYKRNRGPDAAEVPFVLATTAEDIQGFVKSWPKDIVLKVWRMITNAERFREPAIYADPKALAEK